MKFEYVYDDPSYNQMREIDPDDGEKKLFRSECQLYRVEISTNSQLHSNTIVMRRTDDIELDDAEKIAILDHFFPDRLSALESQFEQAKSPEGHLMFQDNGDPIIIRSVGTRYNVWVPTPDSDNGATWKHQLVENHG